MATYLHIDFETRSPVDIEDVGADVYTKDPDAGVWCMAFTLKDYEPVIWTPEEGNVILEFLQQVKEHYQDKLRLVAHNAPFELAVWNNICVPKYGWPVLRPDEIECSMCRGYAMGLPGKLDNMAAALGVTERKDMAGNRLAIQMSRPRKDDRCPKCWNTGCAYCMDMGGPLTWWDDEERKGRLYEYCKQDVKVERAVHSRLLDLSPDERQLWLVDYAINQRGMYVDRPAIRAAREIVAVEQDRLAKELHILTAGKVSYPSQVTALTEWCSVQGFPIVDGLAKQELIDILAQETAPPHVQRALEIRQEYAKTSVAKLAKMDGAASLDNRLRGLLQFLGAATTGRWGGRGVQPQNLPRPKLSQKEIEEVLEYIPYHTAEESIAFIDLLYGAPMNVISDTLRGILRAAPGHRLVAGDYSNIEGRTVAWLAGEQWKLDAFRDFDKGTGADLYLLAASRIYHRPVSDFTKKSPERQIGKVAELACGYQGGVGAFQTMASTYGVKVPDEEADMIKTAWREAHPRIVTLWYDLDEAAIDAVRHPGAVTTAALGKVKFRMSGSFLFCQLPSGRCLCYPYARLAMKETWWGVEKEQVHYKCIDDRTHQWTETHTYCGKMSDNITQAVARDILAFHIVEVERAGFPIVLHVHDEIVVELETFYGQDMFGQEQAYLKTIMAKVPTWSTGLPISIEYWDGVRYRK